MENYRRHRLPDVELFRWFQRPAWTIGESAALSLGLDPASMSMESIGRLCLERLHSSTGNRWHGPGYADDYEAGALFQSFAKETGISVLLIHHTNKADPADPFDALSGTLGTNAAPDSLLVIMAKGQGHVLYGKGRDLPEYDMPITFDSDTCRWVEGALAEDANRSETERKIIDVFARADKNELSPAEVYKAADGLDYDLAKKTMARMVTRRILIKTSRGMYSRAVMPARDFEQVRAFYQQAEAGTSH